MKVQWHDEPTACTDGKTIFLPQLTAATTINDYKRLRHFVTHEVDHVLYSDFDSLQEHKLNPKDSLLGAIWNCLEDHRIEWLGDREYEGDRLCNNDVNAESIESLVQKVRSRAIPEEASAQFMPLIAWSHGVAADYHPSMHQLKGDMDSSVPAAGKKYLEKMEAGNYADVLRNIRTIEDAKEGTAATLALAERLFKEVYEQDPEKEKERAKEQAKGNEGGDGKSKGKGAGKPAPAKEGKDGSSAAGGDKKEEGEEKEAPRLEADYTPMLADPHNPDDEGTSVRLRYDKPHARYDYVPAQQDDYQCIDHTKGSGSSARWKGEIVDTLSHTSQGFAHRVRTLLQIRARNHYQYGLKQGKLHQSSLARIVVDAPGYNERVFKRKTQSNVLDCAVTLLVDQSGSMRSSAYKHAAAAAVMLSNTIGNVLHIPVEIVTFTDDNCSPTGNGSIRYMHLIRKFSDSLVAEDACIDRLSSSAAKGMSGNEDGDSIMWVYDRLVVRPERRKLLVVFSDGQPSGGGIGDSDAYAQQVIRGIEKESPVNIIGIGIQDNTVKRYYKEHYVIHHTSDLENALLSLIERKLK